MARAQKWNGCRAWAKSCKAVAWASPAKRAVGPEREQDLQSVSWDLKCARVQRAACATENTTEQQRHDPLMPGSGRGSVRPSEALLRPEKPRGHPQPWLGPSKPPTTRPSEAPAGPTPAADFCWRYRQQSSPAEPGPRARANRTAIRNPLAQEGVRATASTHLRAPAAIRSLA